MILPFYIVSHVYLFSGCQSEYKYNKEFLHYYIYIYFYIILKFQYKYNKEMEKAKMVGNYH